MLKMLNARTVEIDDVEQAVSEILEQLNIEENLLKNSVGIMSCYSEFIETGVVKALCDSLPFSVVGGTTLSNGMEDESGMMMLCLTVLTADDVCFSTALTEVLDDHMDEHISSAYKNVISGLEGEPILLVPFIPLLEDVGGEMILGKLNAVSGGISTFGTVVCDHFSDYSTAHTIYDGEAARDKMAMLVVSGNIKPRFMIETISDANIQKQTAIITESQGCLLKSVNNMTAEKYMNILGLAEGGGAESLNTIPFIVDYNDGTKPAARVIHMLTPDGYAVCGGAMPVGSALSVGLLEAGDVLKTSEKIMNDIVSSGECSGVLIFPCVSRGLIMGADMLMELEIIRRCADGKIPYHVVYSGGEYCPVYGEDGHTENRFHNFSVIACIF